MTQPAATPDAPAPVLTSAEAPVVSSVQDDAAVLEKLGAEMDVARRAKEDAGEAPSEEAGLGTPQDAEVAAEGAPTDEEVAAQAADAALSPVDRALRAAARARESAGRNRTLMAQQKNLARQNAAAQQQIQQLRAQNERDAAFQRQLAADPYAAMKALGMTEEQLAHRAVREGTPERAIEQIQQQLQEERNARLALENRLVSERRNIAVKQGEVKFVQLTADEARYPLLSEQSEKVVLLLAKNAVEELTEQGYDLSDFPDADLAAYTEHRLAEGRRKKAPASAVAPEARPGVKPALKTLTNGLGTKKVSMPADFDSLSQDEQFMHLGKMAELNLKKA